MAVLAAGGQSQRSRPLNRPDSKSVVRGMFSAFIVPVAGWQQPLSANMPLTLPPGKPAAEPDWRDYASRELWRQAIIAYLRSDWRKSFEMWGVLNAIVAESCQRSRFDVRAATYEALAELMQLCRDRAVYRHRRRWIAILDMETPLPPAEQICPLRTGTQPTCVS